MLMFISLLLFGLMGATTGTVNWGYGLSRHGVIGALDWGNVSKTCNDKAQSPIDFIKSATPYGGEAELLIKYRDNNTVLNGTLINNGHSPTFLVEEGDATLLSPVDNQTYKLAQSHFHFGCNDNIGSEHTVNGFHLPGELHLVFYNTKYENISRAASHKDGLAVIAALLSKGYKGNTELKKFSQSLRKIKAEGATVSGLAVNFTSLVPKDIFTKLGFYFYKGSLTTPGCNEAVSWFVLGSVIMVDDKILKVFRSLQSSHGYFKKKMCNNFRPTQSPNERDIKWFDAQ